MGILALAGMVAGVAACTATEEESSTAGQAVEKAFDRNNVMSDTEMLDPEAYSEQQIQRFFEQTPYGKKSVLAELTINGERASTILSKASATYGVNPLELIVRLQMEQGLISKTAADKKTIDLAFGCGCPHAPVCKTNPEAYTGFDKQAECAARTLRASMDKLKAGGETVSGWKRLGAKATEDGITVTPQTNATTALYSYTPWLGEEAGGKAGVGGMALHHKIWIRFDLAIRGEMAPTDEQSDAGAPNTDGGSTPKADGGADDETACGAAGCTNPAFPVCDKTAKVCVGCLRDDQCGGGNVCDTRLKKCVECTTTNKSKCSASKTGLACLSNQTCGCNDDSDCGSGKTCNPTLKKCEAASQSDAGAPDSGKGPSGEGPSGEGPVDPGSVDEEQDPGHMTPNTNAPPPPKVGTPGTQVRGGGEEEVEVGNGPDKKKTVTKSACSATPGPARSGGFALALGLAVAGIVARRRKAA